MADMQGNAENREKISLTITTPRGVKFVERADMIIMRAIDGDLGVLPGHAPLSAVLGDGVLRIINDGAEKKLAVFGGTVEVDDKAVRIFSTIAQRPDEIDLGRAEEDHKEAEASIQEALQQKMTRRLQILQTRALIRIHVSQTDYFDEMNGDGDGGD